jgi:hypothetical protein
MLKRVYLDVRGTGQDYSKRCGSVRALESPERGGQATHSIDIHDRVLI